jgi:hypothetical protein
MDNPTKTDKLQLSHQAETRNRIQHLRESIAKDQKEIKQYNEKIKKCLESVEKKNQELADAMSYLLDLEEVTEEKED